MGNHLCCRLITQYFAQSQSSGSLNVWDNTKTLEYCTVAETDQPCTESDAHFRSNSYLRDLNTFAHMIVGYEAAGISSWSGRLITRALLLVVTQFENHYRAGACDPSDTARVLLST